MQLSSVPLKELHPPSVRPSVVLGTGSKGYEGIFQGLKRRKGFERQKWLVISFL